MTSENGKKSNKEVLGVPILNNHTLMFLEKGLQGSTAKQKAIGHNLANYNTPGYDRNQVNFKEQLKSALGTSKRLGLTAPKEAHITNQPPLHKITPRVDKVRNTNMNIDGNNVDLDQEMTSMAENLIYQNTAISQINSRIGVLKNVISEGR